MRSFVQSLDLDDEDANYTIGQMMTHLQGTFDRREYEKVGSLLRRREERIRSEAAAEAEKEVEKVRREAEEIGREFAAEMARLERDMAGVEGRYADLVKWKVAVEERFVEVEKENGELVEENKRLREENEELRKGEEAEKVRVLELETKAEVEESLRVRAEEEREASENRFKELELRISKLEARNSLLMSVPGAGRIGTVAQARTTDQVEAAGCSSSTEIRAGTQNCNVVDTGVVTVVEGSASPNPVTNGYRSVIHISDSEDDASGSPLTFKRKRATALINKENRTLAKNKPSNGKHTSQHQPSQQEYERTPTSRIVSICPSSSRRVERRIFHSSQSEWRKSILNKLDLTVMDLDE